VSALPAELCEQFSRDGYCLLRGFYDEKAEIAPIRDGIREIVARVADRHGMRVPCATPEQAMTEGYGALIARQRAWGGEVYDAVKQIPAFLTLVANPRNGALFARLRPNSVPGIAAGGYGIRIDNPGEERFRAPWHQEFPAQLRSPDGIVFWSPLLPVTPDLGPVEIARGSHAEGIVPVREESGPAGRTGAYALWLADEEARLARYRIEAPLTEPGDLLLMDFLTLHRSGENVGTHPRWSMQFRYFNFSHPLGVRIGWAGSFAAGKRFEDVLPELRHSG
jgi:hypothetical protein